MFLFNSRLMQSEVDEQIRLNNTLPSGSFVCPSDGYIYAYHDGSTVTTTGISILDSKGKIITHIILNGRMGTPLYVRKGMIITDSKDIRNLPKNIIFTPFKA